MSVIPVRHNAINVFGLLYSRFCVAQCAHCGSNSGPQQKGVMPMEYAERCLADIPAFGVESVIVSGG